jgi:Invasion associated locus B (IalB) protein
LCPVSGALGRALLLNAAAAGAPVAFAAAANYFAPMSPIRPLLAAMLALPLMLAPAEAAHSKKKKPAPAPTAAPAPPKAGAGAQQLGQSGSWTAYSAQDGSGLVCYIMGTPQKSEPAGTARKAPMAMVTHRPSEKIANVVSFVEGYPIKPGSEVTIDIGGSKFDLFTKDDSAWSRTAELDRMIVASLGKAKQVVVRGAPQKGPPTTDTYALAGFAKALALIDKACGVKR